MTLPFCVKTNDDGTHWVMVDIPGHKLDGEPLLGCNNPIHDKEQTDRLCHAANQAYAMGVRTGVLETGRAVVQAVNKHQQTHQ